MYNFTFLSIAFVAIFFWMVPSVLISLSRNSKIWSFSSCVFFGAFFMVYSCPQTSHTFLLILRKLLQSVFLHCLNPLLHIGLVDCLDTTLLLGEFSVFFDFFVEFERIFFTYSKLNYLVKFIINVYFNGRFTP